jgi:hypothetical protein
MSEEEERRQEILKIREEHKRLSDVIVRGSDYHETMKVRGIDGQEYEIEVRPVNDEEFCTAAQAAGIPVPEAGAKVDFGSNLKLLAALAAVVSGDPKLGKVLVPLETSKIGAKVLELSGLTASPKPESTASSKASTPRNSRSS